MSKVQFVIETTVWSSTDLIKISNEDADDSNDEDETVTTDWVIVGTIALGEEMET